MSASAQCVPLSEAERWDQWDRFVEASPATGFMQSSWWADFRTLAGFEHFAVVLRARNVIVGGALVLRFRSDSGSFYYVPEGPALPSDESIAEEVFAALLESIDESRRADSATVSHLRVEPRWCSLPGFVRSFRRVPAFADPYMEPRDTLCVDLRKPETEILEQMKPKGRYNIQVARRHAVTVVEDASAQGLEDFLAIYDSMVERQGLNAKPRDYFETLLAVLGARQKGSLFFAEHGGQRLAAALVIYFGKRATYFFGASLDHDRRVMAPYLLHFEIMRRAKAMGCEWYDFWGIAPSGAERHPWKNITDFKRKFGGREVNLVPTLDYVFDDAAYERYVAAQGVPEPSPEPRLLGAA